MDAKNSMKMIGAFAAVYLIWGSTYLGIRYAIETIPPLLMAGIRFIIAGGALYAWARWKGAERPTPEQWRAAAIIGTLLFLGGNGAVVWAEQFVPSGLTALLVTTVPLWMVLLDSSSSRGHRLNKRNVIGLLLGFVGVGLLIAPASILGQGNVDLLGALVLLVGSLSWSAGSLYSRRADLPKSLIMVSGMQMLAGGIVLMLVGSIFGEAGILASSTVSALSAASLLYLILFGSIVGFTAYTYLLAHTTPAKASTYAYVNPVVALVIGWAIGGEAMTIRTILAAVVIIAAVMVIMSRRSVSSKVAVPSGHHAQPASGLADARPVFTGDSEK